MFVRRFEPKDAEKVSELVVTTLRTTNIKDYSLEYIENDVKNLQPQNILERANWMHFYVVCDAEKIVGCGDSFLSQLSVCFVVPQVNKTYKGACKTWHLSESAAATVT